jgi:hypothetical protein
LHHRYFIASPKAISSLEGKMQLEICTIESSRKPEGNFKSGRKDATGNLHHRKILASPKAMSSLADNMQLETCTCNKNT